MSATATVRAGRVVPTRALAERTIGGVDRGAGRRDGGEALAGDDVRPVDP
jgi:hypothetical protein